MFTSDFHTLGSLVWEMGVQWSLFVVVVVVLERMWQRLAAFPPFPLSYSPYDVCVCVCVRERERERESSFTSSHFLPGSCPLCLSLTGR